jgi:hypothetical protein
MMLPDRLVLGLDARGSHEFQRWAPPRPPEFAGPADLARVIIAFRDWVKTLRDFRVLHGAGRWPVSHAGLEELIARAYQATFHTDEGRTTRARIFVPAADESLGTRRPHFGFTPPVPLTPGAITRLSTTLAADDAALVVREQEGTLVCVGIGLLNDRAVDHPLLKMPRTWSATGGGLLVHLLAPGELRVSDGAEEYTLRANQIRVYSPAASVADVDAWHDELTRALLAHCGERDPDWNRGAVAVPEADLMFLWSHMVAAAVRLRHGGALIVVPEPERAPIQLKYATEPCALGLQLADLWLALGRAWRLAGQVGFLDALEQTRLRQHELLATAAAVGHLSATDGCVVLDRLMTVYGFGGSISVGSTAPDGRVLVDPQTREPLPEDDLLRRFGERHRSAFQLCKAHPDVLAFVISQDGDLRLFASDQRHVTFHDLLSP